MSGVGWHDEAIIEDSQDEFGRSAIAWHIADLISRNHSWDASRVYGLTGPWGSGKSSVINMICRRLDPPQMPRSHDTSARWVIAHFTPWATDSAEALLIEFYSAFATALDREPRSRKARRALAACLRAAAPLLGLVPAVGSALAESARGASTFLGRQEPWQKAFGRFTAELRKLRVRVLVVADDIDRLQHQELVTLLKVVRLLGRFPGVDYLLAYDEKTLFANLTMADLGAGSHVRARLFMEKIVQYPLVLPPLLSHQVQSRLDQGFAEVLDGRAGQGNVESRLEGVRDVLLRQLSTPRSVDRYLAQLRFVISMHAAGEIDDLDLLLVTFVRMQFPEVYARLTAWRGRLTGHKSLSDMLLERTGQKTDFTELFDGLEGDGRDDARRVLAEIFPVVGGQTGRGEPHISSHYYFDRYLVHMVPEDDISNADVHAALQQARSEGAGAALFMGLLTEESVAGLPDLALDKLRNASIPERGESLERAPTLNLLTAIATILPALESGKNSLFRRQERAIHWMADLIGGLPTTVDTHALMEAISACDDTILRLRIVWDASQVAYDSDGKRPRSSALSAVAKMLVNEAMEYCFGHLALGDAADEDAVIVFPFMYLIREGDDEAVRAQLEKGLHDGAFTTEDFAARCVTLSHTVSRHPIGRLDGFANDVFSVLAPPDDPFYDTQIESVDTSNLSWSSRRVFARGRARKIDVT